MTRELQQGRDFRGYGEAPPPVRWPGDARLAVSLVVNVEEGAEFTLSAGDARNESVYEVVEEVTGVADSCMESRWYSQWRWHPRSRCCR